MIADGERAVLVGRVTSAKVRLQIDVGFGDVTTPEAAVVDFPALLDFPTPKLRAYPRTSTSSERPL